jgi:hypothetical protein
MQRRLLRHARHDALRRQLAQCLCHFSRVGGAVLAGLPCNS